jgi:hypothetical protein
MEDRLIQLQKVSMVQELAKCQIVQQVNSSQLLHWASAHPLFCKYAHTRGNQKVPGIV